MGRPYSQHLEPLLLVSSPDPFIEKLLALIEKYSLEDTLLYSGKGVNDLGDYDGCVRKGHRFF